MKAVIYQTALFITSPDTLLMAVILILAAILAVIR